MSEPQSNLLLALAKIESALSDLHHSGFCVGDEFSPATSTNEAVVLLNSYCVNMRLRSHNNVVSVLYKNGVHALARALHQQIWRLNEDAKSAVMSDALDNANDYRKDMKELLGILQVLDTKFPEISWYVEASVAIVK